MNFNPILDQLVIQTSQYDEYNSPSEDEVSFSIYTYFYKNGEFIMYTRVRYFISAGIVNDMMLEIQTSSKACKHSFNFKGQGDLTTGKIVIKWKFDYRLAYYLGTTIIMKEWDLNTNVQFNDFVCEDTTLLSGNLQESDISYIRSVKITESGDPWKYYKISCGIKSRK